ncbi:MAG: hypothetical protein H6809_07965 [Phycisphaeraceae bacterium]|nr:hypothetical protein [Phycisphaeraceae bacterium]
MVLDLRRAAYGLAVSAHLVGRPPCRTNLIGVSRLVAVVAIAIASAIFATTLPCADGALVPCIRWQLPRS